MAATGPTRNCPECGTGMRPTGACPECGWSAPKAGQPEDRRCTWTTRGQRCQLQRTVQVGRQWVCRIHDAALRDPEVATHRLALEAVARTWRDCSEWTHLPVGSLWAWSRGELVFPEPDRTPCPDPACPLRPVAPLGPEAALAALRTLLAGIGEVGLGTAPRMRPDA
jgi:hypothetical protein